MTDTPATTEPASEEKAVAVLAPRPPREIRVVESSNPVMSTAGFEHLIRVARLMGQSGMMPASLVTDGKGDNAKFLPEDVILARAFLIAEQASRWDESPMAIMQCASLVHGKLMWEGKLVHAILESKFGILLSYRFGTWDPATETVNLDAEGAGDGLGVIVSGKVDDRTEEIHGCVGLWKTTGNGSPWKPGAMRRQLRYRGAREWSRAYRPSAILGIITDDEVDLDLPPPRQVRGSRAKPDLAAKLAPGADVAQLEGPQAGFSRDHVAAETGELPPHDAETGEVLDEETGKPVTQDQIEEQVNAEVEEEEQLAEGGGAEDVVAPGHAQPGENYLIDTDQLGEDKRWPTYKDGVPFSRVGEKGAASLTIYREHAPKVEKAAAPPAQAGEAAGIRDNPEDRREPDDQTRAATPEERQAGNAEQAQPTFMQEISAMTSWLAVKPRFAALTREADWAALETADQDAVRAAVWLVVEQIKKDHKDPVDPATDPTAFRLWMETQEGPQGADAIEGTFRVLCKEAAYTRMKDEQRDNVRNAAEAKIAALRGKK